MKRVITDTRKQLRKLAHHPALPSIEKDEPLKRIGYRDCLRKKGARLVRGRTAETLNLPREHDAPMRLISADILHQGRVGRERSEEHTSELQSLMRISYAVFCLKKKNLAAKSEETHSALESLKRITYEVIDYKTQNTQ